jgi:hypothetical protein
MCSSKTRFKSKGEVCNNIRQHLGVIEESLAYTAAPEETVDWIVPPPAVLYWPGNSR